MDYVESLRKHAEGGRENGWSLGGTMAVRLTEHETPEKVIKAGWWPSKTYTTTEALDFTFTRGRNRVPVVIHKVSRTPWTGRQDRKISYRRALELLAQPVDESEVHNR